MYPFQFSGAEIPQPPANSGGTTRDPGTGSLYNSQIAVGDTPQIFHDRGEIPAVPMLVTEDPAPVGRIARAMTMAGQDDGGNLGIMAVSGHDWTLEDGTQNNTPLRDLTLSIDPGTGSRNSPSSVPVQDTWTIYPSIADVQTCPAITTAFSTIHNPLDYSTPGGTP